MTRLRPEYPERVYSSPGEESAMHRLMEQMRPRTRGSGWMIGGMVLLGLGVWAVYKFGPDFARYMKMERM